MNHVHANLPASRGSRRQPRHLGMLLSSSFIIYILSFSSFALLPVPSYYLVGRVVSDMGAVLNDGVMEVQALALDPVTSNWVLVARTRLTDARTDGATFQVEIKLDDGVGSTRSMHGGEYYCRPGDKLMFQVLDGATPQALLNATGHVVGQSGRHALLDLRLGLDVDADGLPDAWEQMIVDLSNGRLHSIWELRPEDDFDGDSASNGDEYHAATDAMWNADMFQIEKVARSFDGTNRLVRVEFYTLPGKIYALFRAQRALANGAFAWQALRFRTEPGGTAADTTYLVGDAIDYYRAIFIVPDSLPHNYHLEVY